MLVLHTSLLHLRTLLLKDAGEPCGVEYFVRGVLVDESEGSKKTCVNMAIRWDYSACMSADL